MIVNKILKSLPAEYQYFVTVWELSPDDKKTLENLKNLNKCVQAESSAFASKHCIFVQ